MSATLYHVGGYQPAAPAQNKAEQYDDASQTYTAWDQSGNVTSTRPYTASEIATAQAQAAATTAAANQASLQQKAQSALAGNQTFLGLATPTQAQALAQVQALTKQVDALIKLSLGLLSDTSGT